MYGDSLCYVEPSVLVPPSKAVVFALLDLYLHRIDPILKFIHVSIISVADLLQAGSRTCNCPHSDWALIATVVWLG